MKTVRKGRMLATVSTEKLEPWLANKCSDKDASVYNSGWRNFKIQNIQIFYVYYYVSADNFIVRTA